MAKAAAVPPGKLQDVTRAPARKSFSLPEHSMGWTTGLLAVRETRSLLKGVQAEAAREEEPELGGEEVEAAGFTTFNPSFQA